MKYVSIIAMLMMATFASSCVELQYKTDATSRMTYRCLQGRWKFHSTLLRPKSVVPIKASISNKCQKNPNLEGPIAGFACNQSTDMKVLNCLNTAVAYICKSNKWEIYVIHSINNNTP